MRESCALRTLAARAASAASRFSALRAKSRQHTEETSSSVHRQPLARRELNHQGNAVAGRWPDSVKTHSLAYRCSVTGYQRVPSSAIGKGFKREEVSRLLKARARASTHLAATAL